MFYRLFQLTKTILKQLGFASGQCRFYPTCSIYTRQALRRHGLFYGSFLSLKRMLKCHPWHPSDYDPVPPKMKTEN